MQSLREVTEEFRKNKKALGHFNISDSNQLEAIAEAARETGLPVIIGLSEGEREFFPLAHARSLILQYRTEGLPLYLNADHTYSLQKAKEAIDAGVDSVVVDGAQLPLEQNVALSKSVVEYAQGRAAVEGELGYIGQSSKQLDELPEGVTEANLTSAEDAKKFVFETGADMFAPAVGNIHGMLKNAKEPRLHADRIIRAAVAAGIAIVHINTELRVHYRDALKGSLRLGETTPYKFLAPAVANMKSFVVQKIRLFANQ